MNSIAKEVALDLKRHAAGKIKELSDVEEQDRAAAKVLQSRWEQVRRMTKDYLSAHG